MYTRRNLTIKEFFETIDSNFSVARLFKEGFELDSEYLTVSAMEELLCRGDLDAVIKLLNEAFWGKQLVEGSTMVAMISKSLAEDSIKDLDPYLYKYGKALLCGEFMSPTDWVIAHADELLGPPRSDTIINFQSWIRDGEIIQLPKASPRF